MHLLEKCAVRLSDAVVSVTAGMKKRTKFSRIAEVKLWMWKNSAGESESHDTGERQSSFL